MEDKEIALRKKSTIYLQDNQKMKKEKEKILSLGT